MVIPSDTCGCGYYRSLKPHTKLAEIYENDFDIDIKYQVDWSDVETLKKYDIRAEVDDRNEKVGRKIRDNELKRIPYLLVVGEKEADNKVVSVRKQGGEDKGSINLITFAEDISREVKEMMTPKIQYNNN